MTHTPRIAARLTVCKADSSIAGAACATQATNSEQFYAVIGGLEPGARRQSTSAPALEGNPGSRATRAPLRCLNPPNLGTARYGIPQLGALIGWRDLPPPLWARALQRG